MRQKNREITDINEIIEVMKRCDVCRLALNDEGYPYILPLNFGLTAEEGKVRLYFHSALEGYKVDLIKKDAKASFEMDGRHELAYNEEKEICTYYYESVIGRGRIRILGESEKREALKTIMDHYYPGEEKPFDPAAIPRTMVYVLEIEDMTGKRKLPKQ